MSKSRIGALMVLVCLATSITFAQSFFSPATKNTTAAANSPSSPTSAEDFKSTVRKMSQQKQNALTDEYKSAVAKLPPLSSTPGNRSSVTQSQAPLSPPPAPKPADTSGYSTQSGQPDPVTPTFNQPQNTSPSAPPPAGATEQNKPWGIKY